MRGFESSSVRSWVFRLIVLNVAVFMFQIFSEKSIIIYSIDGFRSKSSLMTFYLGLIPAVVIEKGFIWQFFSYMFLHSTAGFIHIFFNMYALLIFGIPIEQAWGSRRFLLYYFFCGVGAGLTIFMINLITQDIGYYIPTIGASGAVFGLLLAFGMLYPNAELLLFFFIPIRAKYLVILYGGLELYLELFGGHSNVSHIGHLGGLLFGLIYFLLFQRRMISFRGKLFHARVKKGFDEYASSVDSRQREIADKSREVKQDILRKLKAGQPLTDDDIQLINYIDIMTEDDGFQCHRNYDMESGYCLDCEDHDICFLREVKKYLKK